MVFLSKGVDKLMEDLLKCVSRAEPSRAEPSRAEPSRAELCYRFALLYGYVGCFALLEGGLVLVALKERFIGIFCPLERCFGVSFIF